MITCTCTYKIKTNKYIEIYKKYTENILRCPRPYTKIYKPCFFSCNNFSNDVWLLRTIIFNKDTSLSQRTLSSPSPGAHRHRITRNNGRENWDRQLGRSLKAWLSSCFDKVVTTGKWEDLKSEREREREGGRESTCTFKIKMLLMYIHVHVNPDVRHNEIL